MGIRWKKLYLDKTGTGGEAEVPVFPFFQTRGTAFFGDFPGKIPGKGEVLIDFSGVLW